MTVADPASLTQHAERVVRQTKPRRGLFRKYTRTLISLVCFVLTINAMVETWIMYGETMSRVRHAQTERAETIARKITDYITDVERQVSWATRASSTTIDRRRADYMLLLTEVPAVVELAYVDGTGHVQLDVTRPDAAPTDSDPDQVFAKALNHPIWYGPTTFVDQTPSVMLGVAHSGSNTGSTVARIGLAALASLVDPGLQDTGGYAYVIEPSGRVVAASDLSSAQIGATAGGLKQAAALDRASHAGVTGWDMGGRSVIASGAPVENVGWTVIVEQPTWQVLQPIIDLLIRLAWLLALGLVVAMLASLFLARRMTRPIEALRLGAEQFAANRFDYRIEIGSRDELEELAEQLNRMANELASSYGELELKVEQRTSDLGQSVRELEALEEIGRAVASSLDLKTVLSVVVTRAVALTKADAGAIFDYDPQSKSFILAESRGLPPAFVEVATRTPMQTEGGWPEAAFGTEGLIRVADLERAARFPLRQETLDAGFRSLLVTALQSADQKLGALILYRHAAGDILTGRVGVMKTLADQSVLAMRNARLFHEVADKGTQLEVANAHRTSFFANMSHELRTPLNAVLGYSELLSDGIYGVMPDRAVGVLERIQTNGKHLLSLINDVLDLTKMEAGALSLSLTPYAVQDLVTSVVMAAEPLAGAKGLALTSLVPPGLPLAHGDDRRLTQALLNLVGNAIKFTDNGSVTIEIIMRGGFFHIAVRDTGPGIAAEDMERIFEEFRQVGGDATRKTTGTGLGLSISRRLVAMHGGTIEVESRQGQGSTFTIILPVRVEVERSAA